MKHGKYGDTFRPRNVEDEVRKSRKYGAPNSAI
jgi:hypothetical protein